MQLHAVLQPSAGLAIAMPPLAAGFADSELLNDDELDIDEIELHCLSTATEIARVVHLRGHIDLNVHRDTDPEFERNEQMRDLLGVTVAFEARGSVIGTIRAVPMRRGLTLTDHLLGHANLDTAEHVNGDDWEMGRLAMDPDFRGSPELLKHCLWMALSYLGRRTRVRRLHASCTPQLARLYRRMGFETISTNVPLLNTGKNYTLIHGHYKRVIEALSANDRRYASWGARPFNYAHTAPELPVHEVHRCAE